MSALDLAAASDRLHRATLSLERLNHVQNVNFARRNIAAALDDSEALIAKVRESNGQSCRIATALELCEELEASPVRGVRYIGAEFRRALTGETK